MSDLTEVGLVEIPVARTAIMKQIPDSGIQPQSPLHHADLESLAGMSQKEGGIYLREVKFLGHLTLRCNRDNGMQLAVVRDILGLELPVQPLTSVDNGSTQIRWLAPDEWLITVPGEQAFEVESRFRKSMPGHYSLVNGSGGQTVIEVRGPSVIDLLKKCTPVDLHSSQFPVGKVVSTVFAKSGAVIRRIAEDRFELVIRRSFADYLWLWLQDASQEFGLVIEA